MKFSQPSTARTINRLRVLNLLAQQGELSRADIARLLDLNKPSTSEIVEQLLAQQLVEEQGKVTTINGRRPTALSLKADSRLVLGVDLGSRTTTFLLADLQGKILRFERLPTPLQPQPKEWGETIIKTCMKLTKFATTPIAGIAVSTSGSISGDGQSILSHDYWSWKDIPLAKAIEIHTKLPTLLVHHVQAMVEAERWFGDEKTTNFFYVNWGEHIACAYYNGNTITAEKSRFGHLPIAPTGLCRCGGIGCLETVAAGWALSEKYQGLTVKQLAQSTDKDVQQSLQDACNAMGMSLIAASAVTGAQKIILGGGIANIDDKYLEMVSSFYREHAHHELASIPVCRSALKEQSSVLGCVAVALDRWVFQRRMLETMQGLGQEKPLLETE
ncbi:ROK family transcriptional regulator [Sphaerochaeta globosa]|uniref:ROK family protein n=1 Tax=Sphaerochaeta globosa (strain ATCC BAA-1886 / DSM 22777 / Buddy) TaxID=158189 RepID=F0RZP1_SPHGB|nr:ROK family transcriptional regulator [Sphaerochaeta globosa]ADY14792.1 ROK family protein [Sphaerochaeta globosa str. Buddy]